MAVFCCSIDCTVIAQIVYSCNLKARAYTVLMKAPSEETIVVREHTIRLVRRTNTRFWQAHYKLEKLGTWIRKSTGTDDVKTASAFAEKEWMRATILSEEGVPVLSKKFKAVADVVLNDLERKVAIDKTRRGSNNDYISALRLYLIPYFGAYNIDRISQDVVDGFYTWRSEKLGRELSASAQANHNAAMNLVMDHAIEQGYLLAIKRPIMKNMGGEAGRRPSFTHEEIQQLVAHMPAWINKGFKERTRMIRKMLSLYVPFIASTGLRPGTETDLLEWRHLEIVKKEGQEPFLYAHIRHGKTSKKGKPAGAVLHRSCWLYLEKLRQQDPEFKDLALPELIAKKVPKKVFRLSDGTKPETLTKQFKKLLVDAEMLACPITGDERTLYSLRHYAITSAIENGATAEQLQPQFRTSAAMIAKYYNHLNPMKNAAMFTGKGDGEDAVTKIINQSPDDFMLGLAEMSTGLNLQLTLANQRATEKLREALKSAAKPKSS